MAIKPTNIRKGRRDNSFNMQTYAELQADKKQSDISNCVQKDRQGKQKRGVMCVYVCVDKHQGGEKILEMIYTHKGSDGRERWFAETDW